MSNRKSKKHSSLEVIVSFEPSRLSDECLAAAYEQVVPLISRVTSTNDISEPEPKKETSSNLDKSSRSSEGECDRANGL